MLNQEQQDRALEMLSDASGKLGKIQALSLVWLEEGGPIKFCRQGPAVIQIGMLTAVLDDVRKAYVECGEDYNPNEEED